MLVMNMAEMFLSAFMESEHSAPLSLSQTPDQPPKWESSVGLLTPVAMSVTGSPAGNSSVQPEELPLVQVIPPGELFTEPLPFTATNRVNSWVVEKLHVFAIAMGFPSASVTPPLIVAV
jgi:hypothetical protein